ncbi:MAG: late competence development ComFB family protein [Spirochaetales bacterium]|nr:late competence development ComFB family protein [Spirochaetales bacterium]
MALEDKYNLEEVRNLAEQMVFDEIEHLLESRSWPAQAYEQETILDLAALSLNHVRPLYRATLLGRLFEAELEEKYGEEIRGAVAQAFKKILS